MLTLRYLIGEVEKFLFKPGPGILQQKQFVSQLHFLGNYGGDRRAVGNLLLRSHGRPGGISIGNAAARRRALTARLVANLA